MLPVSRRVTSQAGGASLASQGAGFASFGLDSDAPDDFGEQWLIECPADGEDSAEEGGGVEGQAGEAAPETSSVATNA